MTAPDISRLVIKLLHEDFVLKWTFINFSIFLLWAVYPSIEIHHEQCIIITYHREKHKLAGKEIIFNYTTIKIY